MRQKDRARVRPIYYHDQSKAPHQHSGEYKLLALPFPEAEPDCHHPSAAPLQQVTRTTVQREKSTGSADVCGSGLIRSLLTKSELDERKRNERVGADHLLGDEDCVTKLGLNFAVRKQSVQS